MEIYIKIGKLRLYIKSYSLDSSIIRFSNSKLEAFLFSDEKEYKRVMKKFGLTKYYIHRVY